MNARDNLFGEPGLVVDGKRCSDCGEFKAFECFYLVKTKRGVKVRRADCIDCHSKMAVKWRTGSPHKAAMSLRRSKLKMNFRLSLRDFENMMRQQGGVCAICFRPQTSRFRGKVRPLCVDHNHSTNVVRGLLCNGCNTFIGHAREDISVLRSAIAYLERHAQAPI